MCETRRKPPQAIFTQSLCDCVCVIFHARQALLANPADQTLSTEHCQWTWSLTAYQMRYSVLSPWFRHHAFALRRNHMQGRVFVSNLTKRNNDTKTQVNTGSMILNFEQSMSTLSLCSNTEAINAQCSYCPLDMGVVELVPFPSWWIVIGMESKQQRPMFIYHPSMGFPWGIGRGRSILQAPNPPSRCQLVELILYW